MNSLAKTLYYNCITMTLMIKYISNLLKVTNATMLI